MAICRACNENIGFFEDVYFLDYYTKSDNSKVCKECFYKLEKVIYSPHINSSYEFDEYLNDLNTTLEKLNIPQRSFENLTNILMNNKAMILKKNSSKATEIEEKYVVNATPKAQKIYKTVWIPANSDKTSISVETTCNEYEQHGYILISTTPIIEGVTNAGYGHTTGIILTFKLNDNNSTEPVPEDHV